MFGHETFRILSSRPVDRLARELHKEACRQQNRRQQGDSRCYSVDRYQQQELADHQDHRQPDNGGQ